MEKNKALIKRFNDLKIPWWLLIIPIYNNTSYIILFKSWFLEFDDRNFIAKYYRKMILRTNGIFVFTLFIFLFFCSGFWVLILTYGQNLPSGVSLIIFFSSIGFLFLFTLIFHPINLIFEPSKISKAYEKYLYKSSLIRVDWNNIDEHLISYTYSDTLQNIKNNLFKIKSWWLAYYSLFKFNEKFIDKIHNCDSSIIYKHRIDFEKHWFLGGGFTGTRYWFLYSSGFWFLGTLLMIHNLFNVRNDLYRKINNNGFAYTLILVIFNFAILALILLGCLLPDVLSNSLALAISSPFILVGFNILYIHIIGTIISRSIMIKLETINKSLVE